MCKQEGVGCHCGPGSLLVDSLGPVVGCSAPSPPEPAKSLCAEHQGPDHTSQALKSSLGPVASTGDLVTLAQRPQLPSVLYIPHKDRKG